MPSRLPTPVPARHKTKCFWTFVALGAVSILCAAFYRLESILGISLGFWPEIIALPGREETENVCARIQIASSNRIPNIELWSFCFSTTATPKARALRLQG
jgi:hypothetical protein